jgi:hypothetical protein
VCEFPQFFERQEKHHNKESAQQTKRAAGYSHIHDDRFFSIRQHCSFYNSSMGCVGSKHKKESQVAVTPVLKPSPVDYAARHMSRLSLIFIVLEVHLERVLSLR